MWHLVLYGGCLFMLAGAVLLDWALSYPGQHRAPRRGAR